MLLESDFNDKVKSEYSIFGTLKTGLIIHIRPVIESDTRLMFDFFNQLSDESLYKRFLARKKYLPHRRIYDFVSYNTDNKMFLVATINIKRSVIIIGLGQYWLDPETGYGELAFVIADKYHRQGICEKLLSHLAHIAKGNNLAGFTAEVRRSNEAMKKLFEKNGFIRDFKSDDENVYYKLKF